MQALGLRPPSDAAALPPAGPTPSSGAKIIDIGGFMQVKNLQATLEADARANQALYQQQQAQPVVMGLAGRIRSAWTRAREARLSVETEMIEAMLARRGQYTPEKLAQIKDQRQPAIYMMVASGKMRQVESLLRDVIIGTGAEKPWTVRPSPVPDLPPDAVAAAVNQLVMEIEQAMLSGFPPTIEIAQQRLREMREELMPILMEEAKKQAARTEDKMEDQLLEGGYLDALDQFITDLATFKTAFIAGPILRRKPHLTWSDQGEPIVEMKVKLEWERRDPLDVYPARGARHLRDGDLIVKHRLSRQDLNEMIGVEGYSEAAIREVLRQYDVQGFREWLSIDSQKATAEGHDTGTQNDIGLIDALQFWGSASGKSLREWGMPAERAPDEAKEYQIEAWMIGPHVIKAVLNADPLARRPLYCASFQRIPGSVWGNSPYDLMRDCQDMCNGAARALAANLGISSGPQVAILSNRLPAGEDVTEIYPWKIWQFESDPAGTTAKPIEFFQPESNATELMGVYDRFSALADEYTGIPRYMAGFETAGAGRTASGMSMMIANASKIIKQVVGSVDINVLMQMLQGLHYHNMRYGDDLDLKRGDINIVALGALSLVTKEAAQVRTNEFLQATANPFDLQIMGVEGRAEVLRTQVKRLDVPNPDKVVPPALVIKQRMAETAQAQMLAAQQGAGPSGPGGGAGPDGGAPPKKPDQEQLQDGSPVVDNFKPTGG